MAKRRAEDAKLDMTPMIDIVFQMIIFFVVSIELDRQIFDENIVLAESRHGPPIERRDPRTVTVDVNDRGVISIARNTMSAETLTMILRQARAAHGHEVPVHIRGDRGTRHSDVQRVLSAVGDAGLWRISIVALKEKAATQR